MTAMPSHRTEIENAKDLLGRKLMDKFRSNPNAWGKVSVEVTIQDGRIQTIASHDTETQKPSGK